MCRHIQFFPPSMVVTAHPYKHQGNTFGHDLNAASMSQQGHVWTAPAVRGKRTRRAREKNLTQKPFCGIKKPSSFCSFPDRVSTQSSLNLSECLEIIE